MPEIRKNLVLIIRQVTSRAALITRTWQLIRKAAPGLTMIWLALLIIQGILPVATVYLTRALVNSLVVTIDSNGSWEAIRISLFLALLMGLFLLVIELLKSVNDWIRTAQSEYINDYITGLVHAQAVRVDLSVYESSEYFDRLYRATYEAASRPLAILESTGSLLQNGITLVGMAAVLIPYGIWLPVLLFASTLPALYVVVRYNRTYHRWWEQTTPDRRWTQYYDVMLTNSQSAPEVRLFNLGSHFQTAYQLIRRRLRTERLELNKKQNMASIGAGCFGILTTGVTLAWMVGQVIRGYETLGDLALFYQAFSNGQSLMRSLLTNVGQIYNNSLFLGNLFEFLDLTPQVVDPPEASAHSLKRLTQDIHFRNITFHYPGSPRPALSGFELTVPAGQVAAIVGENGAGKSTLVKLICRFYDPDNGSIEFDGIDIRDLPVNELRNLVSVLFQSPLPYHATAAENITVGDLESNHEPPAVVAAAQSAGAHEVISRLPQGYETLLGKWFANGAELSAGEWQRVALARAYLRQATIVILDEPTSFMDSWSEADWFERLRNLISDRTAIVITHRFTIAMRADVIHVMQDGRLVESGSHLELIARDGLYAKSWREQVQAIPKNSLD